MNKRSPAWRPIRVVFCGLLFGCAALCTLGCGQGTVPATPVLPLEELPTVSVLDVWQATPPDFDASGMVCPAPSSAALSPEGYSAQLGTLQDNVFLPSQDNDNLEIVHGAQGGIHVELAYRLRLPGQAPNTESVTVRVSGQNLEPCCNGKTVGTSPTHKAVVFRNKDGDFQSGLTRVIFFSPNASAFEDRECCVAFRFEVETAAAKAHPATFSAAGRFRCVDHF